MNKREARLDYLRLAVQAKTPDGYRWSDKPLLSANGYVLLRPDDRPAGSVHMPDGGGVYWTVYEQADADSDIIVEAVRAMVLFRLVGGERP